MIWIHITLYFIDYSLITEPAFPSINFVIYPQFSSRHNPANKQTDKQTNRQKNNADDKYFLFCRENYFWIM